MPLLIIFIQGGYTQLLEVKVGPIKDDLLETMKELSSIPGAKIYCVFQLPVDSSAGLHQRAQQVLDIVFKGCLHFESIHSSSDVSSTVLNANAIDLEVETFDSDPTTKDSDDSTTKCSVVSAENPNTNMVSGANTENSDSMTNPSTKDQDRMTKEFSTDGNAKDAATDAERVITEKCDQIEISKEPSDDSDDSRKTDATKETEMNSNDAAKPEDTAAGSLKRKSTDSRRSSVDKELSFNF